MRCKQMGPVDVNGGVHTARKQHQRKNVRICTHIASRVLCGLGLKFLPCRVLFPRVACQLNSQCEQDNPQPVRTTLDPGQGMSKLWRHLFVSDVESPVVFVYFYPQNGKNKNNHVIFLCLLTNRHCTQERSTFPLRMLKISLKVQITPHFSLF